MKRLIAIALLLTACGSEPAAPPPPPAKPQTPPAPTAEVARDLIANAGVFGEHEFTHAAYSLPLEKTLRNAPANDAAARLAKAKWIALDGDGSVSLTSKSRSDKRFLLRPSGILDIVPLAKKEMGQVTAVRSNPDGTLTADFTWTWIPNEVGALFADRYAGTQNAAATLMWDGTGWAVVGVRKG